MYFKQRLLFGKPFFATFALFTKKVLPKKVARFTPQRNRPDRLTDLCSYTRRHVHSLFSDLRQTFFAFAVVFFSFSDDSRSTTCGNFALQARVANRNNGNRHHRDCPRQQAENMCECCANTAMAVVRESNPMSNMRDNVAQRSTQFTTFQAGHTI